MDCLLTVVSARHAATGLAVGGSASILLQAGVGDTACSVGNRSVVVLATDVDSAARSVANTLNVHGASRGNGSEAENKGGERELHLEFVEGEERGWLVGCSKEDVRCESRPADQRKRKELKIVGRLKLLVEYRTEEARTKLSVLSRHLILFSQLLRCLSSAFSNVWKLLVCSPPYRGIVSKLALVLLGKLGYSHRSCIDAY